jgi:hypothetical protein
MLTMRLRWTGQSRAAFERQYLTDTFYLYHSFSVIVAQPLSFTLAQGDFEHYGKDSSKVYGCLPRARQKQSLYLWFWDEI